MFTETGRWLGSVMRPSGIRSLGRRAGRSYVQAPAGTGQVMRPQEPMDASASTPEAEDRANELYWGSDRSVNQIAEELDLSKGALYGMIRPLPAALSCPTCKAEVVHPNRTAQERRLVTCPECGWEGSEDEADPWAEAPDEAGDAPRATAGLHDGPFDGGVRAIAGGALLGAAVGLALVLWARRR